MRARSAASILGLFWLCACKGEGSAEPQRSVPAVPAPAAAPPSGLPSALAERRPLAPEVLSALVEIRETSLPISPPIQPPQRLSFGKGMLGELSGDRLAIRGTGDATRAGEVTLSGPRALIALPSGSLLAVSSEAVYRFDPGAKRAKQLPRVPFFPDSELFPERSDDGFFWVAHRASKRAYKYGLEKVDAPVLPAVLETSLEGFDGRALAMAKDGVFIYSTAAGLARLVPRGKATAIEPPKEASGKPPWRLLPAERLDQLWVVAEDGEVELWRITPPTGLVRRFAIALTPYEVTATAKALLAVAISQQSGQARRFFVLAYAGDGAERFRIELPSDPATSADDWLANVTRNKGLAASESEGKLAVGGPGWLGVWDIETGMAVPAFGGPGAGK